MKISVHFPHLSPTQTPSFPSSRDAPRRSKILAPNAAFSRAPTGRAHLRRPDPSIPCCWRSCHGYLPLSRSRRHHFLPPSSRQRGRVPTPMAPTARCERATLLLCTSFGASERRRGRAPGLWHERASSQASSVAGGRRRGREPEGAHPKRAPRTGGRTSLVSE